MEPEQNCEKISPQNHHINEYMQLKQQKLLCNHHFININKQQTAPLFLPHNKLCKAIFLVIIIINTPLTQCYKISNQLKKQHDTFDQNGRPGNDDKWKVDDGGEVGGAHTDDDDSCQDNLMHGVYWIKVDLKSNTHLLGIRVFEDAESVNSRDGDVIQDDDAPAMLKRRRGMQKKRGEAYGGGARDGNSMLLRRKNIGSHKRTKDEKRKNKNKRQKSKKRKNKRRLKQPASLNKQPHYSLSLNKKSHHLPPLHLPPHHLPANHLPAHKKVIHHTPSHDFFPHECKFEQTWESLGVDYYPRALKSGRCNSTLCHSGFHQCVPVKYVVDVLHRIKICPSASSHRLAGVGGETWVWEKKEVVVACSCQKKRKPGLHLTTHS